MKKILIAEDNLDIQGLIQANVEALFGDQILLANNGREAIEFIDKYYDDISVVISDYDMPEVNGGQVYLHLKAINPNIPFILATGSDPEKCHEIKGGEVFAIVPKPFLDNKLYETVSSALKTFETDLPPNESKFFRVRKSLIERLPVIDFDLYLKLGADHFVKMVSAHTDARNENVQLALSKNVDWMYCDRAQYADFSGNFSTSLLVQLQVNEFDAKPLNFVVNQIELLHELQDKFNWSPELIELVITNVKVAMKTLEKSSLFAELLNNFHKAKSGLYLYQHSAMICYVSAGILSKLNSLSFEKHFALTVAAMIHDFYLTEEMMENIDLIHEAAKDSENLAVDLVLYRDHPELIANDVVSMHEFDPIVGEILMQHHELPDGSGFPFGLKGSQIEFLSAVFIVAQHLVDFSLKNSVSANISLFFEENKNLFHSAQFEDIMRSLESTV